jgi:hypothetical protein
MRLGCAAPAFITFITFITCITSFRVCRFAEKFPLESVG